MQPYRPHGTEAAARRHYRAGEKPCQECLEANRKARLGQRRAGYGKPLLLLPPVTPEPCNGIPWRPYVYRGSGADAYTGEVVTL